MGAAKEVKGRVRESRTRPCDYLIDSVIPSLSYRPKSALVTEVTVPVDRNSSMVSA